jgi:23S rRNA (cytidine1920-2'-O)/16S rRNA (cytidine1409-2'-O)-methyltransferase
MPVKKPASLVDEFYKISVIEDDGSSYVSRGGLKLEKALDVFGIDPNGMKVIDIGASTGGFTDCLLRRGARSVTAVDVGYGQLAWSLRNDPRVTVMERTNIRNVTPDDFDDDSDNLFDMAVIDVSFISLDKILDSVVRLLADGSSADTGSSNDQLSTQGVVMGGCGRRPISNTVVSLVKPQFEAGRERIGKKGVVREASVHRDILSEVWDAFERRGLCVMGLSYSPIKGPEGNIEFLIHARRVDGDSVLISCSTDTDENCALDNDNAAAVGAKLEVCADGGNPLDKIALIEAVVDEAHNSL